VSIDTFKGYHKTKVVAKVVMDPNPAETWSAINRATASDDIPDEYQMDDLAYVKFILASEHENDNADYFRRSELIRAWATPRHKPFNVEHNIEEVGSYISQPLFNTTKNTIIGHIVDSALATKDGTILTPSEIADLDQTDDPNRAPEESLDLLASAVLYDFCFPKTVDDIKQMAEAGEMFVSMEAWFKSFDFLVASEIVQHTEDTQHYINAWHHQKSEGGRRVCRVLNNVLFGGVAATEKPANKGSIFITASLNQELDRLQKRHDELHILYNVDPNETYAKEHEEVTRAIATIRGEIDG
jgi:hypothetical protein